MITERIDAITKIPPEYLKATLPAPRSVKIELSGRCNFLCGFCALRTRELQPTEDMSFDFFKRVAGEMRQAGVEELGVFYLGESFMAPRLLVQAIEHAKSIGFPYVFLTTNGSLAKPSMVLDCFRAGLDSLKFSINAASAQQFEKVMGKPAALYRLALRNLKEARRLRDEGNFKCGIYASSIRYDGAQQVEMELLLRDEVLPYVDEHYWLPLYSMGSFATQREEELGYRPIAGNQGRLGALRSPLPCWSAFTEGHIRSDGHLSVCCFGADDKFDAADLTKVSFMEGWNSALFQKIREAHLKKDVSGTMCQDCIAYAG